MRAPPIGVPEELELERCRGQEPVQPLGAREVLQGVGQRLLLVQDLDVSMPRQGQSEQAGARAGKPQQEDVCANPSRRRAGPAPGPAVRRQALHDPGRALGGRQGALPRKPARMDAAKRLAGAAPGVERLLGPVLGVQRVAQVARQHRVRLGIRHQPADARLGGGGHALRQFSHGQDDDGVRVVRRRLQHGARVGRRRLVVAVVAAQGGHAGPGGDLVRLQLQRLEVAPLRGGESPPPLQRPPLVRVGFRMPRLQRQRRFEDGQRLPGLLQAQQASGERVHDRDVGRLQCDRTTQMGDGLLQPPGRLQRHRHDAEQHRMLQARLQGLVGEPGRTLQVPVVERSQDGAHPRVIRRRIARPRAGFGRRGKAADPELDVSRRVSLHHESKTRGTEQGRFDIRALA